MKRQAFTNMGSSYIRVGLLSILGLLAFRLIALVGFSHPLFGDEAQYWAWSRSLEWGYFSKPPLIAAVIKMFTLCNDQPTMIRIPFMLAHFVTASGIFVFLRDHGYANRGLIGALFYLLLPGVFVSSQIASTDPLLLMCWSWAMVYWGRILLIRSRVIDTLMLGVVMGLGFLAKYAMIWFVLSACTSLVLCCAANRRRSCFQQLLAALLIAALFLLPNLYWNFSQGWITFVHTSQNIGTWDFRKPLVNLLTFVSLQIGILGPLASWYMVTSTRLRWPTLPLQQFLWLMSIPLLTIISFEALVSRAYGNWASPAFVGLTLWFMTGDANNEQARAWRAMVSNALIGVIIVLLPAIYSGARVPQQFNPYERLYTGDMLVQALKSQGILQQGRSYVIINDNRSLTAQLTYLLRSDDAEVVRWNPHNQPLDYFALKTKLEPRTHQTVLFVGRWCLDAHRHYFAKEVRRISINLPPPHYEHCVQELEGYHSDRAPRP